MAVVRAKRIAAVMLAALLMVGCAKVEREKPEAVNTSRFIVVELTNTWRVLADKETGVMYVESLGMYNAGTFTLLVDADGKPLIYKGAENE